jgi:hypothetical protein
MKKSILTVAAVFIASIFVANAQTATASGDVTVNINLHKFQSLTINQSEVNIDFVNQNDYENGSSSDVIEGHLTVSSTGGFAVKVQNVTVGTKLVNGETKTLGNANSPIQIVSTEATKALTDAQYANNVTLEQNATVVSSTKGQFNKDVNVQYFANTDVFTNFQLAEGGYVDNSTATTQYKVQVTYTITVN